MSDELDRELARAADALRSAARVCVLTGAGISAESGVPTFRASDGLWEGHRIEDVASPFGFERDPRLVWNFYNARRANVRTVQPNPGHHALTRLEARWDDRFAVVTQNVDGLHRVAGTKNLYEIHGSLYRTRCTGCGEVADRGLDALPELPHCHCGAMLRPDIVWFHESLPDDVWTAAVTSAAKCSVMLVVGTSAVVHPAASLIPLAKRQASWDHVRRPAIVIEVNMTRTEASDLADIGLYGPSGQILPKLVDLLDQPA
ncbi:NAD-dependent deacylase [bacterium]|nr:NAD-dependent deacylase [bacterium]